MHHSMFYHLRGLDPIKYEYDETLLVKDRPPLTLSQMLSKRVDILALGTHSIDVLFEWELILRSDRKRVFYLSGKSGFVTSDQPEILEDSLEILDWLIRSSFESLVHFFNERLDFLKLYMALEPLSDAEIYQFRELILKKLRLKDFS